MFRKSILFLSLWAITGLAWAEAGGIGDWALDMADTSNVLVRLMLAASFVTGVTMLIMGITYFRNHRMNPKMIPLATPITYLVIGILLIAIPFFGQIFQVETGNPLDKKRETVQDSKRMYYDNTPQ